MSIYQYKNYITGLKSLIADEKVKHHYFSQTYLSQKANIQNTYLTNALKGRANLSSDQLFALATVLKLPMEDCDYLLLLREENLCQNTKRKKILKEKINRIRQDNFVSEKKLKVKVKDDAEYLLEYYSDPLNKIVHICLDLNTPITSTRQLAQALHISENKVEKILDKLKHLGLIKFEDNKYQVVEKGFHLPAKSPITWSHQSLLRIMSVNKLNQVNDEKKYSFSVTFSSDEETKKVIRLKFLNFLNEIQELVSESSPEKAYQLNFDLFPWLD